MHVFHCDSLLVCLEAACLPPWIWICLFVLLPICLHVCFLFIYPSACVRISAYLFRYLFARFCISVCRSLRMPSCSLSVFLPVWISACLPVYKYARLLEYLSVCVAFPTVWMSAWLIVCLYLRLCQHICSTFCMSMSVHLSSCSPVCQPDR